MYLFVKVSNTFWDFFLFPQGARIVVPRTEDRSGNGTQKIMVTGTSQQIEYAKGLIEEKVEEDKVSRRTRVQEYVTGW